MNCDNFCYRLPTADCRLPTPYSLLPTPFAITNRHLQKLTSNPCTAWVKTEFLEMSNNNFQTTKLCNYLNHYQINCQMLYRSSCELH
ncbi:MULTISPECIES: hypothetical protein [unclassified Moorena]|uniref:hypothetical protein n=1 Tax=unclassified Moorena TaxID=2683338 RepID=UPI0013B7CA37|nr:MULTISPECIES: hypothetical protein [unclassified Moorena]NEQ10112.1 hypothetical protein [Moorena sp. SIO4E2]NER88382.1 hypothetical protein [Moorena sp. SIO3A2]